MPRWPTNLSAQANTSASLADCLPFKNTQEKATIRKLSAKAHLQYRVIFTRLWLKAIALIVELFNSYEWLAAHEAECPIDQRTRVTQKIAKKNGTKFVPSSP